VVPHTELDELQLFKQNAATPPAPTAHKFPPEVANVTALSPTVEVTSVAVTGVHSAELAESRDVPCKTVAPPRTASPTIQPSDELVITIDLKFGVPAAHGV
jgi:hypothetical protein